MKRRASDDKLGELHTKIAEKLLAKIADGTADARDYANAIRFLKDNGIEAVVAPGSALGNLANSLPKQFGDDDGDDINPLN